MCTLLYPDIIIASKVVDSFECVNSMLNDIKEATEHVYISIDSCICLQNNSKNMGVENVFVGNKHKEWDKNDYVDYLEKMSHFFLKEENDSPFYKVNMSKIVENVDELNNEEDIIRAIRKQLLTQYTYSPCTLRMMGLSLSEEWK